MAKQGRVSTIGVLAALAALNGCAGGERAQRTWTAVALTEYEDLPTVMHSHARVQSAPVWTVDTAAADSYVGFNGVYHAATLESGGFAVLTNIAQSLVWVSPDGAVDTTWLRSATILDRLPGDTIVIENGNRIVRVLPGSVVLDTIPARSSFIGALSSQSVVQFSTSGTGRSIAIEDLPLGYQANPRVVQLTDETGATRTLLEGFFERRPEVSPLLPSLRRTLVGVVDGRIWVSPTGDSELVEIDQMGVPLRRIRWEQDPLVLSEEGRARLLREFGREVGREFAEEILAEDLRRPPRAIERILTGHGPIIWVQTAIEWGGEWQEWFGFEESGEIVARLQIQLPWASQVLEIGDSYVLVKYGRDAALRRLPLVREELGRSGLSLDGIG